MQLSVPGPLVSELTTTLRGATPPATDIALAVGHDLVYVPEFRGLLSPRFIARAYTARETAASQRAFDPVIFLASRWAAKEAGYKAVCDLATARALPLDGLATFRDYEVVRRPGTRVPALVLHGGPRRLVETVARGGPVQVSVSLTDEHDYAAAFVVIACCVGSGAQPQGSAGPAQVAVPAPGAVLVETPATETAQTLQPLQEGLTGDGTGENTYGGTNMTMQDATAAGEAGR